MNAGVCSYCFNKLFLNNEISVPEAIRFVGTKTDSDFAVYDDEAAAECVSVVLQRLETTKLLGADRIRLDPRTSLPGNQDEADLGDVLEK
jgi:hypothetical protein